VSGEAVKVLPVEEGPVNVVRFSPDGEVLATGSDDGTVRLWDVSGGGLREELTGHDQGVLSLAFDPQSDVLVSGSTDQTVRLWETATGAPITSIAAHAGPVWSVALDPTRRLLASAGEDGLVRLWDWVVDAETACELAAPFVTATQMKEYLEPAGASATCPLP
jgi:WD40 repeat protein